MYVSSSLLIFFKHCLVYFFSLINWLQFILSVCWVPGLSKAPDHSAHPRDVIISPNFLLLDLINILLWTLWFWKASVTLSFYKQGAWKKEKLQLLHILHSSGGNFHRVLLLRNLLSKETSPLASSMWLFGYKLFTDYICLFGLIDRLNKASCLFPTCIWFLKKSHSVFRIYKFTN